FNTENYLVKTNGQEEALSLNEVISVVRNSIGGYKKTDGSYATAAINTPRLHYVDRVAKKGLLSGSIKRNELLNSASPATQTVTFALNVGSKWVGRVVGSGKMTLSGAISGEVTENSPLTYTHIIGGNIASATVTATITGSLSYIELAQIDGTAAIEPTRIITTNAAVATDRDIINLNQVQAGKMIGSQGTIILETHQLDGDFETQGSVTHRFQAFQVFTATASNGFIFDELRAFDGMSQAVTLTKQNNGSTLATASGSSVLGKKNNYAIAFDKQNATIGINNSALISISDSTEITAVGGRATLASTSSAAGKGPNLIITKAIFYNRKLSDSEITQVLSLMNG
ncbi:hypothetical protein OC498_13735, partial [Acinetobacter bohemicus]|uniref:hypothetical protein n=2 Tax=Acinetobacter TaxID=469 RepID=UPI0021D438DE